MGLLKNLFSLTKQDGKIKVRILGIKISKKYFNMKYEIMSLKKETQLLRILLEKSIDITKIPKAIGTYRKVQLIRTKILEIMGVILKENKLTYWIGFGTLIGAIRHKGFIPWDDDIDLCVLKEDYLKLPALLPQLKELDENFWSSYGDDEGYEIIRFGYKDFCIDFFPFEYLGFRCETEDEKRNFEKNWLKVRSKMLKKYSIEDFIEHTTNHVEIMDEVLAMKKAVFGADYAERRATGQIIRCVETLTVSNKCGVFDEKYIFPLKEVSFENLKLPSPNDPIEYLYQSTEYGTRGAVMKFPKIDDSGYHHMLNKYDIFSNKLDYIYEELLTIVKKQQNTSYEYEELNNV